MKTLVRYLSVMALLPTALFLASCGDKGGGSPTTYITRADGQCVASNNTNQIVAQSLCYNSLGVNGQCGQYTFNGAGQCVSIVNPNQIVSQQLCQQSQLNPACSGLGINGLGTNGLGINSGNVGYCWGIVQSIQGQVLNCSVMRCTGQRIIDPATGMVGICL